MSEGTSGETQTVDLGTHRLRVRTSGAGGTAFVCLHDLGEGLEVWDPLAERLAAQARVVRFDARGHGFSTAPAAACTRVDLAADLLAVLDRLGVERAVLVGDGLGGVVALTAALEAPGRVAGLVLLATPTECDARRLAYYKDIVRAGEVNALEGLARAIHGPTSTNVVEGVAPGIVAVARTLVALHDDPLTPRLGAVSCPALILVGEADTPRRSDAELLRSRLGRSKMEALPGPGRALPADAAAAIAGAISAWGPPS